MIDPIKGETQDHPIPMSWRPMISEVVRSFTRDNFELQSKIEGIAEVPAKIANQNRDYVNDYGETLI